MASASWRGRVSLAEADGKPGRYYVTARDERGRTAFLLGPFVQPTFGQSGHARALGAVRGAREYVGEHYPRSMGWTFGTSRLPLYGAAPIGKLNVALFPGGMNAAARSLGPDTRVQVTTTNGGGFTGTLARQYEGWGSLAAIADRLPDGTGSPDPFEIPGPRIAAVLPLQACRDCGADFPYDPDADRCPACIAAATGAEIR